jgi:hypothetical protein
MCERCIEGYYQDPLKNINDPVSTRLQSYFSNRRTDGSKHNHKLKEQAPEPRPRHGGASKSSHSSVTLFVSVLSDGETMRTLVNNTAIVRNCYSISNT